MLGVYGVGSMMAITPLTALQGLGSGVFFPTFSRIQNAGGDLRPMFRRLRRPLVLLAGWTIAGLAGGGDAAVRLFYDDRYAAAGWIVSMLALGSWFSVLEAINSAALLALGRAQWMAAANAGKLAGMVVLIPIGYAAAGFPGAVLGVACAEVLKYAVSLVAASRAGLAQWRQDLAWTAWLFTTAGATWLAAELAHRAGASELSVAALAASCVTIAWAPMLWPLVRSRAVSRAP
jgi:O-antigen/teichoic acid export membrane protein